MATEQTWTNPIQYARQYATGMYNRHLGPPIAFAKEFNTRLGSSWTGRAVRMGLAETFGGYYEGSMFGQNVEYQGWLGRTTALQEARRGHYKAYKAAYREARQGGQSILRAKRLGRSAALKYKAKSPFKAGVSMLGRAFGVAFTAAAMYQGYQEEGAWGAAKGLGQMAAFNIAMRMIPSTAMLPLTAAAAAGVYVYGSGEMAKEHIKQLRRIEFGGPQINDVLNSAGVATTRQRALSALQNTHLNGRMAMGNEAILMHSSY